MPDNELTDLNPPPAAPTLPSAIPFARLWPMQFGAMLLKNFYLTRARPASTLTMIFFPVILLLSLGPARVAILDAAESGIASTDFNMDRCVLYDARGARVQTTSDSCYAVIYTPRGEFDDVMELFAAETGLDPDRDIRGFAEPEDAFLFVLDNPGYADYVVEFHEFPANVYDAGAAALVTFDIYANETRMFNDGQFSFLRSDRLSVALQTALSSHLLATAYPDDFSAAPEFEVTLTELEGDAVLEEFNSPFVVLIMLLNVIMIGTTSVGVTALFSLNHEHVEGITAAMRRIGLLDSVYLLSWMAAFLVISFVGACATTVAGVISGYWVFTRCDASIHIFTLTLVLLSNCALGLFCSTVVHNRKWTYLIAVVVFLLSQIMTSISSGYDTNTASFYDELLSGPNSNGAGRFFLFWMPWVHYSRLLSLIARTTQYDGSPIPSVDMTWSRFGKRATYSYFSSFGIQTWEADSGTDGLGYLVLLCLSYYILAWYVANIKVGKAGTGLSPFFIFSPIYWGISSPSPAADASINIDKARYESRQNMEIRTHKLSKSFENASAFKELSMTLKRDQVSMLLGSNGAGKTTFINVITGLLKASAGEAFIMGFDVKTDLASIRPLMAICPQHDVLWPALTARQHLNVYGRLRGGRGAELQDDINNMLSEISLHKQDCVPAGSFSGGMKRRLSLGLTFMGDSRLVYLDEPTTGLDPINRRRIWQVVNKRKTGRIVVMTTHDLNEADQLGDNVAILASGRLRALGTPVFLKSHFGAGFQIQLLCKPERVEDLEKIVSRSLPGSEIISSSAGNLTVALTKTGIHNLRRFFKCLERRHGIVREWGISNSTLEEVFLRVAATDSAVNAAVAVQEDATQRIQLCIGCGERNSEMVTLYAASGFKVQTDQFLCGRCAADGPPKAEGAAGVGTGDGDGTSNPDADDDGSAAAEKEDQYSVDLEDIAEVEDPTSDENTTKDRREYVAQRKQEFGKVGVGAADKQITGTALFLGRFNAIFTKNMTIIMRQRKTIALQLVIVCAFLGTYAGLFRPGASQGISGESCNGYFYGDNGYYFDPVDNPLVLCDAGFVHCRSQCDPELFLLDFRYQPSYHSEILINGECVVGVTPDGILRAPDGNFGDIDVDQFRCIGYQPWGGGHETSFTGWGSTSWRFASNSWGWDSLSRFSPVQVWYADFPEGASVADLDPLGLGAGQLRSGEIEMTEVNSIEERFASAQAEARDKSDLLLSVCPAAEVPSSGDDDDQSSFAVGSEDRVWYIPDGNEALDVFLDRFPDLGIEFQSIDPLGGKLALRILVPQSFNYDASIFTSELPDGFNDRGTPGNDTGNYYGPDGGYNYYYSEDDCVVFFHDHSPWMHDVVQQLADIVITSGAQAASSGPGPAVLENVRVRGAVHRMPDLLFPEATSAGIVALQVLFFGYSTVIWFPVIASILAQEKYSGLLHIIQSTGVSFAEYALANYAFAMVYLMAVHLVIMIFGFATGMLGFDTSALVPYWFLVFLMWGHVQASLSFLLAGLMGSARMATMAGYLLGFLSVTAATVIEAIGSAYPESVALWGPLAYLRMCGLLFRDGPVMSTSMASMVGFSLLAGLLLMVPGYCLLALDPERKISDVLSPSKMLQAVKARRGNFQAIPDDVAARRGPDAAYPQEYEFVREEEEICSKLIAEGSQSGVVIEKLVKVFGGAKVKVAVSDLSLSIAPEECLALLAPNGGGKSTTINMLVGLLHPTSGTATVCGHPLGSKAAVERIGRCPQFDIVWDDLTVQEHFAFFARMRGLPNVRTVTYQVAEQVSLDGDPFRQMATTLSGGMKRRLSIGISLVGDPSVLLLDEPTTGVSPELRHGIWEIVQRERTKGRAILLTTHSMEEASTLASRVAIASLGRLIAIGTPLELKNRIGGVFKMEVSLSPDGSASEVASFVKERICEDAIEVHDAAVVHQGQLEFALPRDKVEVATVFEQMEARRNALNITEWNFGLTSLDEVFVKVVERDEADF